MAKEKPKDICQIRCIHSDRVSQAREAMLSEEALEEAQILFGALSDKSRLKILHALSTGQELCVCDVATMLEVKVATASHHLRKLRDLKLLKYRNDGKLVYYSLRDSRISDILHFALCQIVG